MLFKLYTNLFDRVYTFRYLFKNNKHDSFCREIFIDDFEYLMKTPFPSLSFFQHAALETAVENKIT